MNNITDYKTVKLSGEHTREITSLFDRVIKNLQEHENLYVYTPSDITLSRIFAGSGFVAGVRDPANGSLVAASIVEFPLKDNNDMGLSKKIGQGFHDCSVLRNFAVHPEYQGKGIGSALVDHWLMASILEGKNINASEVVCGNDRSLFIFVRRGFHVLPVTVHSHDAARVTLVVRDSRDSSVVPRIFEA